jgi:hypothetical protein
MPIVWLHVPQSLDKLLDIEFNIQFRIVLFEIQELGSLRKVNAGKAA